LWLSGSHLAAARFHVYNLRCHKASDCVGEKCPVCADCYCSSAKGCQCKGLSSSENTMLAPWWAQAANSRHWGRGHSGYVGCNKLHIRSMKSLLLRSGFQENDDNKDGQCFLKTKFLSWMIIYIFRSNQENIIATLRSMSSPQINYQSKNTEGANFSYLY